MKNKLTSIYDNPLYGLGYSPREGAFLRMAAMHSGYFLRRQFVAFAAAGDGKAAQLLCSKVKDRRHGQVLFFGANHPVYWLSHPAIYRVLGDEASELRKRRGAGMIKARLLALDLVLAHSGAQFLETAEDKIKYFSQLVRLSANDLPHTDYSAYKVKTVCRRWFAERFPIFITGESGAETVHFGFIDEGETTVSSFARFLDRYKKLLERLKRFRLIYVAESAAKAEAAGRYFENFKRQLSSVNTLQEAPEWTRFCEIERRWREYKSISRHEFFELCRGRRAYQDPSYEARFRVWLEQKMQLEGPDKNGNYCRPVFFSPPVGFQKMLDSKEWTFETFQPPVGYGFLSIRISCGNQPTRQDSHRASPGGSSAASLPVKIEAVDSAKDKPEGTWSAGQPLQPGDPKPPAGNDPAVAGFGTAKVSLAPRSAAS